MALRFLSAALSVALVVTVAHAGAGSYSIAIPLSDCPDALNGRPPLVPVGRRLLVPLTGDTCGLVTLLDGRSGREIQRFDDPSPHAFRDAGARKFGSSAARVGRRILVGAPDEHAAYAFDMRSGALLQTYQGPDQLSRAFGSAVLGVGSRVLVSDPNVGLSGPDFVGPTGAVHVFDAASGRLEGTIASPADPGAQGFGFDLAAAGSGRFAVGTIDAAQGSSGHVFVLDAATRAIRLTLTTPPGSCDFGGEFAAVGDRLAAGVPQCDGPTPGAVAIFDLRDGRLVRTIADPTGAPDGAGQAAEAFGATVALSGDRLLVGAPFAMRDNDRPAGGTVYLFDAGSGRLRGRLAVPDDSRQGTFVRTYFTGRGVAIASFIWDPGQELDVDHRAHLVR